MKKIFPLLTVLVLAAIFLSCNRVKEGRLDTSDTQHFEATVASLQQYECPEWFRDAKFGIYMHWGVYSVAEMGEWYARNLYIEGTPDHAYHQKTLWPSVRVRL